MEHRPVHMVLPSPVSWSALKGETVPDSLPATPKSPPTHRRLHGIFPTQGSNPCLLHCRRSSFDPWSGLGAGANIGNPTHRGRQNHMDRSMLHSRALVNLISQEHSCLLGEGFGCGFVKTAKGYSNENSVTGKEEHCMDFQGVF